MIPEVTLSIAQQLGILPEEYDKILNILGRTPTFTELSVYAVMWSEHCSYKNSILQLKTLPKEGKNVIAGAGDEGAGLMDLGNGYVVAFKMESHNHPSAIEPYQGAATGVGGIHRDIFSLGARPVAALDSLRFGDLDIPKTRHLLKGVVKGIGDYGNAFGIPTVSGEIFFDPCYNTNPLVNAMSVGIAKRGTTVSSTARGVGNPVLIVGSATGKDGIHGATFASEDISENSEEKLPSVQVGDPFTEKLLLEATLEAIASGAVVGVQDMGAAGITCATSEMSAKGKVGMDVWLDRVPMRQTNMHPFEILLSESQERMLLVVQKGREGEIKAIFDKWDLHCAVIGVVTEGDSVRYFMHDEKVGDIPAESLVLGGGAPVYVREQKVPEYMYLVQSFRMYHVREPENIKQVILHLLDRPNIGSKHWIREQYDSTVGAANASTNVPSDAAVVRLMGQKEALALGVYCNSRYVYSDPEKGAMLAVATVARSLVCSGAQPLGVTNCLNFGNPYNPEIYYQFAQAIKGMGAACRAFETPITGGNVSFYNQSEEGAVYPTPSIGMVGLVQDLQKGRMSQDLKLPGHKLYLLGKVVEDLACSEYIYSYHGIKYSPAPYINLEEELHLQQGILKLIAEGCIASAHKVSNGGLILALLESAFHRSLGFAIYCPQDIRKDAFLFGEAGGRVLVSVAPEKEADYIHTVEKLGLDCLLLGETMDAGVYIDGILMGEIDAFRSVYDKSLERRLV